MKAILTFAVTLFATVGFAAGAESVKNKGTWTKKAYSVSGGWSIVEDGGKHYVKMDGSFKTKRGPDLKIFLSPTDAKSVKGSNATKGSIRVAVLKSNKGAQKYEIPSGTDLSNFNSIVIHCEKFSKLWSAAAL